MLGNIIDGMLNIILITSLLQTVSKYVVNDNACPDRVKKTALKWCEYDSLSYGGGMQCGCLRGEGAFFEGNS
jgi:hypothetical protein